MRERRCMIGIFLLPAFIAGCLGHDYRPVCVQVRDAETKLPIPGAEVRLSYPMTRPSDAPAVSLEKAGTDGQAHVRAAPFGDHDVLIDARAAGYMAEEKTVAVAAVRAIETAHWFEAVDKRPPNFVIDLYAEPRPSVELVLPAGFRGQIKAEVVVHEDATCPINQRVFRYSVPPTGEVQIAGPHLIGLVASTEFRAVYDNGTPITSKPTKGDELGFWCLKCDEKFQYFLVGTQMEYNNLRPSMAASDSTPSKSSGGKSGGGRHGHKGNQQPTDGSQ